MICLVVAVVEDNSWIISLSVELSIKYGRGFIINICCVWRLRSPYSLNEGDGGTYLGRYLR